METPFTTATVLLQPVMATPNMAVGVRVQQLTVIPLTEVGVDRRRNTGILFTVATERLPPVTEIRYITAMAVVRLPTEIQSIGLVEDV